MFAVAKLGLGLGLVFAPKRNVLLLKKTAGFGAPLNLGEIVEPQPSGHFSALAFQNQSPKKQPKCPKIRLSHGFLVSSQSCAVT